MIRTSLIICLLLISIASSPVFPQTFPFGDEEGPPPAGWLTSGDTFSVYPEIFRRDPGKGTLTSFMPSREIRTLHASYDTLWIGTEGGLFAWDIMGDSLSRVESFPFTSVRSIISDDYYRLWVGCDEGLCFRDSTWRVYSPSVHPFFERIRDLTVGSEKIWIASYGQGAGYLSADSLVVFAEEDSLLDNRVLSISEETASEIWFGTASGVCSADSFRWESMRYGRKIPTGAVNDLIFDENRSLFIAIRRNGLARLKFGKTTSYTVSEGLPGWNMNAFSLAPDGRLIAAGNGGACYYDGSGWTPLVTEGLSLSGYDFFSVHHDFSGNCFLGSDDGSVIVMERNGWRILRIPQRFPASRVSAVYPSGSSLFLITDRGFFRLDESLEEIELPAPWYSSAVTGIEVVGESEFWLSTRFGALHFTESGWKVFDRRLGLPTEYLTSVAVGGEGALWFGTFDQGILCLKDGKWYSFSNSLPDNRISDLMVDRDSTVWALTLSGRLIYFDGTGWVDDTPGGYRARQRKEKAEVDLPVLNDPAVRVLSGREENSGAVRRGVCLGRGVNGECLFVDGGAVYSNASGTWMKLRLPDAGFDAEPSEIFQNSRGELWLGTRANGILVFNGKSWSHMSTDRGFSGSRVLSISEDADGVIWIGTGGEGLHRFEYHTEARIPGTDE